VRAFAVVVVLAAAVTAGAASSSTRPVQFFNLVAIGDSLPYGQFDCGDCKTFVDLYAKSLQRHTTKTVSAFNLSEHTGINSTDLLRELRTSSVVRTALRTADAITVTIGHNDTPWNRDDDACDGRADPPKWKSFTAACARTTARVYERNLDAILGVVRSLRAGKPTILRVTNDYNDLIGDPHVPASFYRPSKAFYELYTSGTCRLARKHGALCIDTYHAFNGRAGRQDAAPFLAVDHTHPSARGHRLIARLLDRAGYRPLFR
jgi:lysophospholipase L1-like esterase